MRFAVFLITLLVHSASAEELRWDAATLLKKSVTQDVRLTADGSALELDEGELFENDGPAAGYSFKPNTEKLSASTWIRTQFDLPSRAARKAWLLVAPGGDLEAIVNGRAAKLTLDGKTGQYWQKYALEPDVLKPGRNDVVLFGKGTVWIARDDDFAAGSRTRQQHLNRSAKSSDAGKTWDDARLGVAGDVDGEYCVRLFLERQRPRGSVTLPVVDIGNLSGKPLAPPYLGGQVQITADSDGPVRISVRTGPTLVAGAKEWSEWRSLPMGNSIGKLAERFLQVKIDLATDDPLRSPRLRAVRIESDALPLPAWAKKVRIVESHNEEIVRTSVPFEHEPFEHPVLKKLRAEHRLDDVVAGAKTELELMQRLAKWSAGLWRHPGHIGKIYPTWNALEILKPHPDGTPVGGFCQQYNLVFLQACASFGLPGRAVSIGPGDHNSQIRGGHEVVEIWSNELGKWVYVDGQAAWVGVDAATRTPLSLWELRQRQLDHLEGKKANVEFIAFAETRHEWKGLDAWPPFMELRLIPRSNFLEKTAPLPLNQGMRGWFWTGHHVWSDARGPAALIYGQRLGQRSQWEWTLNQARLYLEATETPGALRVHLDTETPSFARYEIKIDDQPSETTAANVEWKLHRGRNRLEVRPINTTGRAGRASWVVVEQLE